MSACKCSSRVLSDHMPNSKSNLSPKWSLFANPVTYNIIESVCLFVCLFAVNAKPTARIDAKRSGITKNDPESVLYVLKSPVLVFLGRYRDISGFSFAADRHFNLSHFHFRLLRRRLYNTERFRKTASTVRHIAVSWLRETSHLERKCYC